MSEPKKQHSLIVGCVGVKGQGKSHKLREMIPYAPRIVIVDTALEHADHIPNQLSEPEQIFEFLQWSKWQKSFACTYCPEDLTEDVAEIVPALLDRQNMVVALEEVPEVCDGGKVPKRLRYLIRVGRHYGIDIAYTGQRFSEIARTITSQTDIFILFRQSEPLDVDGVAKRTSRDIAERVKALDPGEFIVYDVRQQKEVPFLVSMFSPQSSVRAIAHIDRKDEEESREVDDGEAEEDGTEDGSEAVLAERAKGMSD
jgi:hypothetical protein